jgi:hypothetical protein
MADAKLKVTFTDIYVSKDGDPTGKGEVFWSFKVDGSVVSSRTVANPRKTGSGEIIALGEHTTTTKSGALGTKLVISGFVGEKDSGFDGKDEYDAFSHNYTSAGNWGTGHPQSATISDKNLNATVNYIIERV